MTTRFESRTPLARLETASVEAALAARSEPPARSWADEVRRSVDAELGRFFESRAEATRRIAGDETLLVDAIAALTMRGGKRLRPCVMFAAHRAVGAEPGRELERLRRAGAGLELLQSYLLIHDDWMDGDDERRGGPAVHTALRARSGDAHLGDALAVLAGDLASAYAWELVTEAALGLSAAGAIVQAFVRIHQEVVLGQELDLLATHDVSRMQKLKTGSYTVEGPLRLGALFGGASAAQLAALETFGGPLGEAFQMRDDLLGAFGDPGKTGKPRGNDLRAGKRTALVRECERASRSEERTLLASVLGRRDASDADVQTVLAMLERSGVRERVEQRLAGLLDAARAALASPELAPEGVEMLRDLVGALAMRES